MSEPRAPARLRGPIEEMLETLADTIKDAVLDWAPGEETDIPAVLPPAPVEQFLETLRAQVEVALQRVAQVINDSPTGELGPPAEQQIYAAFAVLADHAVREGQRLRVEAAAVPATPQHRPQGQWARRYRSMLTADADPDIEETIYQSPVQSEQEVPPQSGE